MRGAAANTARAIACTCTTTILLCDICHVWIWIWITQPHHAVAPHGAAATGHDAIARDEMATGLAYVTHCTCSHAPRIDIECRCARSRPSREAVATDGTAFHFDDTVACTCNIITPCATSGVWAWPTAAAAIHGAAVTTHVVADGVTSNHYTLHDRFELCTQFTRATCTDGAGEATIHITASTIASA